MKKHELENAIKLYRSGERPWAERKVNWHLVAKDGELLPLKYVYGLATGSPLRSFNTYHARRAAVANDYGVINLASSEREQRKGFEAKVEASLNDPKGRKRRLENARKKPTSSLSTVKVYRRNPDVVAEVLDRAKGKCEKCKQPAPFVRAKDNTPYLEVHHKKTLANGGDDTVKNALALCPNCHREAHYG